MTDRLRFQDVYPTLKKFMLADGLEVVIDLDRSKGTQLFDGISGERFLDFFTCFASWPIGYHHDLLDSKEFQAEILEAATHNPSNSDLYSRLMAEFVGEFGGRAPPEDPSPSILGVGWGARSGERAQGGLRLEGPPQSIARRDAEGRVGDARRGGTQILHFREAFHGRTGYTLSLTNTSDPRKTALFPKFRWPRVLNPKIRFPMEGRI